MQAASAARGEEKKKPRGEVVKYPREFLMKFAEVSHSLFLLDYFAHFTSRHSTVSFHSHTQRYTQLPTELQFNNLEIVLDPSDPEREAQRALLQRVAADDADERDWRSRTPLPPAPQKAARETTDPSIDALTIKFY